MQALIFFINEEVEKSVAIEVGHNFLAELTDDSLRVVGCQQLARRVR